MAGMIGGERWNVFRDLMVEWLGMVEGDGVVRERERE